MAQTTKEICEYTLGALKAAGADMASCSVAQSRLDELNVLSNQLTLMRTVFSSSVSMKVVKDMKKGIISVNKTDKDSIDSAVKACMDAANVTVPDEAEGISELIENKNFDDGTAECDLDKLYYRLDEYLKTCTEKYPKILNEEMIVEFSSGKKTYMNSNGVEFNQGFGAYGFSITFSAHDGEKGSSFNGAEIESKSFDMPLIDTGIVARLLSESEKSIYTKSVEGKFTGTVIFTPNSILDLIYTISSNFVGDMSLINGTSIWKDKLNQQVASPTFNLVLNPYAEGVINAGRMVTGDGYLLEKTDVIRDGILKNFLLSRYAAKKTGLKRTFGTSSFLMIEPGDKKLDDIIASIEHGLYVDRLSGGEPSANGEFSGVAKNSFIIENGKITDAVSETMISLNIADALKNVFAISSDTACDGTTVQPWVAIDGVTISGK